MNTKNLELFSNLVKVGFSRTQNTLTSGEKVKLELFLNDYFLSLGMTPIFTLFTSKTVVANENCLCISFCDIKSFDIFHDRWIRYISDNSGFVNLVKKEIVPSPPKPVYSNISVIIYGNTLSSLGGLIRDEINTQIINSK